MGTSELAYAAMDILNKQFFLEKVGAICENSADFLIRSILLVE